MKGITFSLHLQQPILATSFQGDPNSDVSYPYIPGSLIRGAFINCYRRYYQLSELDLNDSKVRSLFFDEDKTRYLNAYLLSQNGERTLPVPQSWCKDKNAKLPEIDDLGWMTIYDRADEEELSEDNFTPKGVEQKFCTINGEFAFLYSENRRINIHNKRNRKKGKGTREEGEIFRYDALDARQTFQAVIVCEDVSLIEEIQTLLKASQYFWLGGSQSAGYGQTEIQTKTIKLLLDDWNEVAIDPNTRVNSQNCKITLLSDTILRNECGQTVADAKLIVTRIEETLGIKLPFPQFSRSYTKNILIGGFNKKWGLPLPQVQALSTGSVVIFEGINLNLEQIKKLECKGIGERRNEGFGRIAINWLEEKKLRARKPQRFSRNQQEIKESSLSVANLITERILQQRLEQKLVKKLGERDTKISNLDNISNSQLSKLGMAAREGLRKVEIAIERGLKEKELQSFCFQTLRDLLNPENLTKNALKQFQQTDVDGDSLYNKLNSWLDRPQSWLVNLEDLEVTLAPNLQQGLNDKLITIYTLRLIIAVTKNATKEKE